MTSLGGSALCARAQKRSPTDVCVPISRLAECVTETQADIAAARIIAPIVGHVGDGNFHFTLLVDVNDPDEVARAEALARGSPSAPSRWRAPAPASTASGR